jgi:hypothetical protein
MKQVKQARTIDELKYMAHARNVRRNRRNKFAGKLPTRTRKERKTIVAKFRKLHPK